jgi:hypothetical protein
VQQCINLGNDGSWHEALVMHCVPVFNCEVCAEPTPDVTVAPVETATQQKQQEEGLHWCVQAEKRGYTGVFKQKQQQKTTI